MIAIYLEELRDMEGLLTALRFESWELRPPVEKIIVSCV